MPVPTWEPSLYTLLQHAAAVSTHGRSPCTLALALPSLFTVYFKKRKVIDIHYPFFNGRDWGHSVLARAGVGWVAGGQMLRQQLLDSDHQGGG